MNRRAFRVDPALLLFARNMRREPAPAEQILWSCLRDRQLNGFKFRRQYAIDRYVADFCCPECKLIVELDGDSHEDRKGHDEQRTAELLQRRFEVLRFPNTDVFDNLEVVLTRILELCEERSKSLTNDPSPLPSPPSTGE